MNPIETMSILLNDQEGITSFCLYLGCQNFHEKLGLERMLQKRIFFNALYKVTQLNFTNSGITRMVLSELSEQVILKKNHQWAAVCNLLCLTKVFCL